MRTDFSDNLIYLSILAFIIILSVNFAFKAKNTFKRTILVVSILFISYLLILNFYDNNFNYLNGTYMVFMAAVLLGSVFSAISEARERND